MLNEYFDIDFHKSKTLYFRHRLLIYIYLKKTKNQKQKYGKSKLKLKIYFLLRYRPV